MTVAQLAPSPAATARPPAAVEAALAVCRELAADVRATDTADTRALWTRELLGARRVLHRLTSRRYFVGSGALLDRWDGNRVVPGTSGLTRRELVELYGKRNRRNAAEVDDALHAELAALDPALGWPALG